MTNDMSEDAALKSRLSLLQQVRTHQKKLTCILSIIYFMIAIPHQGVRQLIRNVLAFINRVFQYLMLAEDKQQFVLN